MVLINSLTAELVCESRLASYFGSRSVCASIITTVCKLEEKLFEFAKTPVSLLKKMIFNFMIPWLFRATKVHTLTRLISKFNF
jgi:hypothetical protein